MADEWDPQVFERRRRRGSSAVADGVGAASAPLSVEVGSEPKRQPRNLGADTLVATDLGFRTKPSRAGMSLPPALPIK